MLILITAYSYSYSHSYSYSFSFSYFLFLIFVLRGSGTVRGTADINNMDFTIQNMAVRITCSYSFFFPFQLNRYENNRVFIDF